ncbi:MAG: ABC transporter permease [Phycisphaerales bacterium]|nr:ABC transporter permease [Phycisphaerales bacterium]MCB9835566.1 ABC transporter permease [Phycisphaera sp.]
MFQSLLTRRYLTSKVMPLLASAAVMLSVAMELITWSVMGGFLEQLIQSGRTLMGDVEIARPQRGFGDYEKLIEMLEADEWIEAATPTIDAYGLVKLNDTPQQLTTTCRIKGIDPESFNRVTGYFDTLYWKPIDTPMPRDKDREDPRLDPAKREMFETTQRLGQELFGYDVGAQSDRDQAVLGIEVFSKRGLRSEAGFVTDDWVFLPGKDVTLNVLPIDMSGGFLEPVARKLQIGNEFSSNIYEIDSQTIYVPLDELQQMLKMDRAEIVETGGPIEFIYDNAGNPIGRMLPEVVGVTPARVTSVLVRGVGDHIPLRDLQERVKEIYTRFESQSEHAPPVDALDVLTWQDRNATLIGAIKKETALVLFIFGIISLTSVFLVLAIFWSMISERTKDIGILRALGASGPGVAWLWVRYGLAIGVVGSILGGILAYIVITNINAIHDWMGATLGIMIWDPQVYYFARIPEDFNLTKALIIVAAGIVSCGLGALIPAWRAARMDPVKALRFE